MNHSDEDIPILNIEELQEILVRAAEESWTELTLVYAQCLADAREIQNILSDLKQQGYRLTQGTVFQADRPFDVQLLRGVRSLEQLIVLFFRFDERLAEAIQGFSCLASLCLDGNRIGDDGAVALAQLTNLAQLELSGNQIGDDGAVALGNLTNLASLNLSRNQIYENGAVALGLLPNLTSLDLGNNQIGDDGAAAVGNLAKLTSLDLRSNRIGDYGAVALGQLTNLTSLDLRSNQIGDDGAVALGQLTNLTSLDLRTCLQMAKRGDIGYDSVVDLPQSEPAEPQRCQGRIMRVMCRTSNGRFCAGACPRFVYEDDRRWIGDGC